jgi:hypothetical protein
MNFSVSGEKNMPKVNFSKEFVLDRIDDIERSILDIRLDKERVPQITLNNLDLNKHLLRLLENSQSISFD